MKTAVSIPNTIFDQADALAKRLGVSRSKLFSMALQAYIDEHRQDKVKEALDEIYSEVNSQLDESLMQMQLTVLKNEDW